MPCTGRYFDPGGCGGGPPWYTYTYRYLPRHLPTSLGSGCYYYPSEIRHLTCQVLSPPHFDIAVIPTFLVDVPRRLCHLYGPHFALFRVAYKMEEYDHDESMGRGGCVCRQRQRSGDQWEIRAPSSSSVRKVSQANYADLRGLLAEHRHACGQRRRIRKSTRGFLTQYSDRRSFNFPLSLHFPPTKTSITFPLVLVATGNDTLYLST